MAGLLGKNEPRMGRRLGLYGCGFSTLAKRASWCLVKTATRSISVRTGMEMRDAGSVERRTVRRSEAAAWRPAYCVGIVTTAVVEDISASVFAVLLVPFVVWACPFCAFAPVCLEVSSLTIGIKSVQHDLTMLSREETVDFGTDVPMQGRMIDAAW